MRLPKAELLERRGDLVLGQASIAGHVELLENPFDRADLVRWPAPRDRQRDTLLQDGPFRDLPEAIQNVLRYESRLVVSFRRTGFQKIRAKKVRGDRALVPVERQHVLAHADRVVTAQLHPMPWRPRLAIPIGDRLVPPHSINVPRQLKRKHLEEDAATTEDVGLRRDLAAPHLGCHGDGRATWPVPLEIPRPEKLGDTEVNHHDVRICAIEYGPLGGGSVSRRQRAMLWHEHDVRRLQIQVDDAVGVHMRDRHEDLPHHVRNVGFCK
mmetsp:Transcript_24616/g.68578  ORF Transcript_24616/g.68578 Transcript_24616/m.68578 type:complete len:268 (+) Transcript_24616:847-1650(+)